MRRYTRFMIRSEENNFPHFVCNLPALCIVSTEIDRSYKSKVFNKKALYKLLSMVNIPK